MKKKVKEPQVQMTKEQQDLFTKINNTVASAIFEEQIRLTAELCGYPPFVWSGEKDSPGDYRAMVIDVLKTPALTDSDKMLRKTWLELTNSFQKVISAVTGEYMKAYQEYTKTYKSLSNKKLY